MCFYGTPFIYWICLYINFCLYLPSRLGLVSIRFHQRKSDLSRIHCFWWLRFCFTKTCLFFDKLDSLSLLDSYKTIELLTPNFQPNLKKYFYVPIWMGFLQCTFSIFARWSKLWLINKNLFCYIESCSCQTEHVFRKFVWTEWLFCHVGEPLGMNVICFNFGNIASVARNCSVLWLYGVLY